MFVSLVPFPTVAAAFSDVAAILRVRQSTLDILDTSSLAFGACWRAMTIALTHDSTDHRTHDNIQAALEQLRRQLLAVQHAHAVIISIFDLHTKRELTEGIILSFDVSINSADSTLPSSVSLLSHTQKPTTTHKHSAKSFQNDTPSADDDTVNKLLVLSEAVATEPMSDDTEANECEPPDAESNIVVSVNAPTRIREPLSVLYSLFKHTCDMYFGVDVALSQMDSTSRLRRDSATNDLVQAVPDTVNTGNGELTRGSMTKVFDYLMHHTSVNIRLTSDSSFLDLGSGYGKCVIHAMMQARVKRSVGIEWVPKRYQLAQTMLDALQCQQMDGFAVDLTWAGDFDWDQVQFVQGDVADEQHKATIQSATHVYMFDKLFRDETKQQLLSWLNESNALQMLACYTAPSQLRRSFDNATFHLVHQLGSLRSTGGEQFTCYFYRKASVELLQVESNPVVSPRRSDRVRTSVLPFKREREQSHSFDRDPEWSLPSAKRSATTIARSMSTVSMDMQLSELVDKLELASSLLAAEQAANQSITLDLESMQSAAEAANVAASSLYRHDDRQSVIEANHRLEQLMCEADGFKMVGYYFRSLLAQALYEECKRTKQRDYNKQAAQVLGIASRADRAALPQFAACIQRHAGGRDRCTVKQLLMMPLIRADIPWHEWRDRLLVGKGKLVDEAMRIVSRRRADVRTDQPESATNNDINSSD